MNVLFLNNGRFAPANSHTMYSDLMREFQNNGHIVYVVSANEKRFKPVPEYYEDNGIRCVCVRIGNLTKCNLVEKALTMMTISQQYIKGIKKYYSNIVFDLVLYPTPPISLLDTVLFVKKRDKARSYLILKDIFPQNAIDLGMMSKTGIKGLLYKHFRNQEKKLYRVSDRIGCMSQANVDYVIKHNPEVDPNKVEVCPNSIEVIDKCVDEETRNIIRSKYGIPLDKKVFVYGGNLGRPQGIPFLIKCLHKCKDIDNVFFLIVGEGTEYGRLENYVNKYHQKNLKLMKRLPKEDYDTMVAACDVGMIFLDHRFTIPNFPSRLLGYMQAKLPVLAVTDPNTDIGKVIVEGEFGWWCESNDSNRFVDFVKTIISIDSLKMKDFKNSSYQYLELNYSTSKSYNKVIEHF